jgi:hypothetical protein
MAFLDLVNALLAFLTSLMMFAASAYSYHIYKRIPKGEFSTIFPFLTLGLAFFGLTTLSLSGMFLSQNTVVGGAITALFFCGTFAMMYGAIKVSRDLGPVIMEKARAEARKKMEIKEEE